MGFSFLQVRGVNMHSADKNCVHVACTSVHCVFLTLRITSLQYTFPNQQISSCLKIISDKGCWYSRLQGQELGKKFDCKKEEKKPKKTEWLMRV